MAWIHTEGGKVLSTRSRGRDAYCLPGGKREPGESDVDTPLREIREELTVAVVPESAVLLGVFEAQAHGRPDGVVVRMTCYTAAYEGRLEASGEIEEVVWLAYGDRHRTSPVDWLIFDRLHAAGLLL
ncbi:NUDIX domain-containing protein [Kitasatospora sp. NPDC056651]|uniref:NUDIX hydrolase n=1 Tax=Kitasatospora sp. NPDC056651 TaxID=3345892 RepID=UPI0036B32E7D